MSRFKLLLLDANVVICLFELGLWDHIVKQCDVHLSPVVIDESDYYMDANGIGHKIDLNPYLRDGAITTFAVPMNQVMAFRAEFSKCYEGDIDDGEAESLTYLLNSNDEYTICSADHIVFQILGSRYKSSQGISLEELLKAVGKSQKLDYWFTKAFREDKTRLGFADGLQGISDAE